MVQEFVVVGGLVVGWTVVDFAVGYSAVKVDFFKKSNFLD